MTTFDDIVPALTLSAAATGAEVTSSLTLPAVTLSAVSTHEPHLSGAIPVLIGDGYIATGWTLDERIFLIGCSATSIQGGLATIEQALPALTVVAATGADARIELPALALSAELVPGTTATATLTWVLPALNGTAAQVERYAAEVTLPLLSLAAEVAPGGVATLDRVLPAVALDAAGFTGAVSTLLEALPLLECEAAIRADGTATLAETLPALQLFADAVQALSTQAARTWVLNLRNEGLMEYTNWAFNSMTYFNGKYLGASDAGIVELGVQVQDGTTNVAARARTGKHDMGSSFLKRLPYGYLECATDGDAVVSTITSEDGQRDYLVPWNGNANLQNCRVNLGRRPKSKHWQLEFANRNGSTLRVVAFDTLPRRSHRRVQ